MPLVTLISALYEAVEFCNITTLFCPLFACFANLDFPKMTVALLLFYMLGSLDEFVDSNYGLSDSVSN